MLIVGVDGHKQTLACSLIDEVGREFDARTFANAPQGHDELVAWAQAMAGPEVLGYGLESALSFTRVLGDRLVADGAVVFDVPPTLVERSRRQRGIGKSDIIEPARSHAPCCATTRAWPRCAQPRRLCATSSCSSATTPSSPASAPRRPTGCTCVDCGHQPDPI